MRFLRATEAVFPLLAAMSVVGVIGCGSGASEPPSSGIEGGGASGFVGGAFGGAGGGPFGAGGQFAATGQSGARFGAAGSAGAGQLGTGAQGSGGAPAIGGLGGSQSGAAGQPGQAGAAGQLGSGGQAGSGQGGTAGQAGNGGGDVGDHCTDRPVTGLSLSGVDAYQSVQIHIMKGGTAVAPGTRNADLVVGRQAVFRVYVTPDTGWTPRQVSARIELASTDMPSPSQKKVFFGLLTPKAASSDDNLDSTFQVKVPADAIGSDTRYSVSLVDCDAASTAAPPAVVPRFPSQGYAPLGARKTGPLKIHVVPMTGTNITMQGLQPFKERLEAVYPITDVQFTIGNTFSATASSMCALLASVTSLRSQDAPPNDVYYYALSPGILGGQSGCSNTSANAIGSKVSAGWAQGYTPDDGTTGAATMCHEVGHAHGRLHAPCNVQDPDPQFPYPNANIGVWGYDHRSDKFLNPTSKDMMSYCPEPRWQAWISDYTYKAILERAAQVNGQPEIPAPVGAPETLASWRLLVSDSAGVHSVKEPLLVKGTPDGEPVGAVIFGEDGAMLQVVVYKQRLEDGVSDSAFMLTLPEPDASWRAIEVPGTMARQPL